LDGDVWLSSFEEPVVTMIARRGRIVEGAHALAAAPSRVRLPGSAEALAVGGGYLWVTSPSDSGGRDTVFQIDLRSRRLVSSLPVGTLPLFVASGYGSAWISSYTGDSVSVVRPGSEQPETIAVPGGPLGIAAGEGAIWVVTFWSRELVRIDPETRRVLRRIPVGAGPLDVAVGAGSVWVTNRDDRTISRIDPATNELSGTIRLPVAPYGIRVAHGRVWVTTQRCGSPVVACGPSTS
jgi:DNA-binding beta-propeller fold protein YncE